MAHARIIIARPGINGRESSVSPQAACRAGGAESAACQWTGAEAQRAVPTAPPWVHVLLPFLLLNVLDVCIRAYFYQIGASWTPTRVPRNAQLSHLAAIVSAVCSAAFKARAAGEGARR